ncbi:hypothetical protein [Priestia megaterium]|uniref:hypothetical protein n=1 Tax=Priestia megaterium TaxID=1404 RepID=UPI002E1BF634|nr:hypothetical protein [Priestia megaterium]
MAEETIVYPEPMSSYIQRFRNKVLDTDPLKNILNDYQLEFTDSQIAGWITEAWYMINETEPRTNYRLERFPKTALLLDGAMMVMLEARGLLHLRNQLSYSDAGFSVNLDDKAGHYAQWLAQKATLFYQELKQFKRSQVPRFYSVGSPMRFW